MTAPNPNAIPAGAGPQPPGTFRADSPKKPALNVVRFLEAKYSHGNRYTLLWHREEFHVWVGTHYRTLAEETLRAEVYETFENAVYIGQVGSGPNAVPAWVDFDIDPTKMNAIMSGIKDKVTVDRSIDMPVWFETDGNIVMDPQPVDPREMIACQNGLLRASTRDLWGHTPRFLNTFSVGYPYLPDADAPAEWLAFLKSIWPEDQESIDALQEIFGYLLTQRNEQQKMFMLYGAKRGGKGTIIHVLEALMGEDNVTGTSMSDLNKGDFGLASLEGKQLAVMSDVRFRSRDDGVGVERLLKITGNDSVLINKKFKQAYTAHLTTRFLIASNELPKMTDESGALQSRIVLLKFTESFLGREDKGLEARLLTELPGILNWALDGLDRLDSRGSFIQPGSGAQDLDVITELSSPSLAFIKECCIMSPVALVKRDDMWSVWQAWCSANNILIGSKISFGKAMRAAVPGLKLVKRGPRGKQEDCWEGVDFSDAGLGIIGGMQQVESWLPRDDGAGR